MKFFVYLLECRDKSLYCGYTKDLTNRIKLHNQGKASKYTSRKRPVELVYFEEFETQGEAMRRELAIKKLSKSQKLLLIRT